MVDVPAAVLSQKIHGFRDFIVKRADFQRDSGRTARRRLPIL